MLSYCNFTIVYHDNTDKKRISEVFERINEYELGKAKYLHQVIDESGHRPDPSSKNMPRSFRIGDKVYVRMYKNVEHYWEREIVIDIRSRLYDVRSRKIMDRRQRNQHNEKT